jgi:hypothetical protein
MKLCVLVVMCVFSISSFAQVDKVRQILNSHWPNCDRALKVYEQMENKTIEDLSRNYGPSYYEVYGNLPNGKNVTLYLTMAYSCEQGSRGGGGCSTKYQCQTE